MNRIQRMAMLATVLLPVGSVCAASGSDYLDAYFLNTDAEASISGLSGDDDGNGLGIRGKAHVAPQVTLHGEFQSSELDDSEIDIDSLRFGGGVHTKRLVDDQVQFLGEVEFVQYEFDSLDQDGFGAHGGILVGHGQALQGYAKVGYLDLDDIDGLEWSVGASFELVPNLGAFVDYRVTDFENEANDELELSDLRIGARLTF